MCLLLMVVMTTFQASTKTLNKGLAIGSTGYGGSIGIIIGIIVIVLSTIAGIYIIFARSRRPDTPVLPQQMSVAPTSN